VSFVWLFRHGQAGTRANYDTLSALGREQAWRLGAWLAQQDVRFTGSIAGELSRQRETAAAVGEAFAAGGLPFPALEIRPGWNEFDLDGVYRDVAPALAAADPEFRSEYEQMRRDMEDEDHSIHRRWTRCDLMVMRAWVEGRAPASSESWAAFQERIAAALDALRGIGPDENVAVFTSATPIGLVGGAALGADTRTRIRLAGALYNAAFAVLRVENGEAALFSFNNIPHLGERALHSFR
jgi:broad specificity phosphatase PhoE